MGSPAGPWYLELTNHGGDVTVGPAQRSGTNLFRVKLNVGLLLYHLVLMGKLLLGNGCEVAVGFM